jgi:hypothetical protein
MDLLSEYISSSSILSSGTTAKIDPLTAVASLSLIYFTFEGFNKATGRETLYRTAANGIISGCKKVRQKFKDR